MSVEREVFYEVLPRGWWTLAAVAIGAVVFLALLVMLLISGANFHKSAPPIPAGGTCYPFCTAPAPPPP